MGNIMIYIYSYIYSHMPSCLLNRRNERGATMVEQLLLRCSRLQPLRSL